MTKRFFVSMAVVLLVSLTASAISINKAMLQHEDQVTLFDGDKIQDAVDAAMDGDIIYLTLGTFKPFNVTKKITIRGTGATSVIDGDVNISILNNPTLENPVLEALAVSGSVTVNNAVSNFVMRQCKITSVLSLKEKIAKGTIERCQIGSMSFTGTIQDLTIDRCFITSWLTLSSTIESMTVINTKIYSLSANSGTTGNTTFVNCNVYSLYVSLFSGTIINSIILRSVNGNGNSGTIESKISSTVLLNTQYTPYVTYSTSSVLQNCYYLTSNYSDLLSNTCDCKYNTSTLQSKGYLGTDGTVVGIYGGATPYDDNMLVLSVPKVTSSDLQLDMEQKKLNVTLTVSPQ